MIVDVEATAAHRTEETEATNVMIERVAERHEITPQRLIGDTAYRTGSMLKWLVQDKGIEPHVPVWEKLERTRRTAAQRVARVQDAAVARHAGGHPHLPLSQLACAQCPLKPRCCRHTPMGKVPRSLYEKSRAVARLLVENAAYRQSCKHRKKVEVLFAHLRRILKLDRLRPRGRRGAWDEFLLAATAQNLR